MLTLTAVRVIFHSPLDERAVGNDDHLPLQRALDVGTTQQGATLVARIGWDSRLPSPSRMRCRQSAWLTTHPDRASVPDADGPVIDLL